MEQSLSLSHFIRRSRAVKIMSSGNNTAPCPTQDNDRAVTDRFFPSMVQQDRELDPIERRQILVEWNATEVKYPKEQCIHDWCEAHAEKAPDSIALIQEDQNLTYGELNASANRLAAHLRELGVGTEARVEICGERRVALVMAMLATLKAGGAYVPLDPAYPHERLAYMLEDSAPVVLLIHDASRSALTGHSPAIPILNLDRDAPLWAAQSEHNPDRAEIGLDARNLAYIIYTSGSTGLPKGVMVEHRCLVNFICWHLENFQLCPGEHSCCVNGIGFDASACEIWTTLCAGANLLLPSAITARDPELLLAWWQAQPLDVCAVATP